MRGFQLPLQHRLGTDLLTLFVHKNFLLRGRDCAQDAGIPLDQGFRGLGKHGHPSEWSLSGFDSLGHRDDHPTQGGIIQLLSPGSAAQGLPRCRACTPASSPVCHQTVPHLAKFLEQNSRQSWPCPCRALETQPGLVH